MTPESIFRLANAYVLPAWLLLLFLPRWHITRRLVPALFAIPLAAVYVWLLAAHWGEAQGGFDSLNGVASLFANRYALLGGWIHYLVFDLFTGAWILRDSQRAGLPHLVIVPCLLLAFLLGPAGLLLYWTIRAVRLRQTDLMEA